MHKFPSLVSIFVQFLVECGMVELRTGKERELDGVRFKLSR